MQNAYSNRLYILALVENRRTWFKTKIRNLQTADGEHPSIGYGHNVANTTQKVESKKQLFVCENSAIFGANFALSFPP